MDAYRATHLHCEAPGCHRVMHTVDHIVPLAEGGDRHDWENYQSLCKPHHDQKTHADSMRGKTRAR
jgi:5-methylcytosine-specific restriction endonuclease McrA